MFIMKKHNYSFNQNRECEYFPCHKGANSKTFNCLFCYCPLYALGRECGGNFTYTQGGIKNCTNCLVPHSENGYEYVISKISLLNEKMKKQEESYD